MRPVWYFFKTMEAGLGLACITIHLLGFINQDLKQNSIIICTVFGGFTTAAFFGHLSLCLGIDSSPLGEAWLATTASVCYLAASVVTMYHAEKDFIFMYLADIDTPSHPVFKYSKAQGIASLAASMIYTLHACLAFDAAADSDDYAFEDSDMTDLDRNPPLVLYFFGKMIHERLMFISWYKKIHNARASNLH